MLIGRTMTDQKHVNIPLPPSVHKRIKAAAANQGVPMRQLIQSTLQKAFNVQSPPKNKGAKS